MTTKDHLQTMRNIKDFVFATIGSDEKPSTRIIDVMLIENDRLYFLTARGKEFYSQLQQQKFVSLTGMTQNWEMLTLRGKVKQVSQDMLTPIFEANPSMHDVYPGDSRTILEVFCLYEGQGEYFNLSKTPIYRETFFLGNPSEQRKGFEINSSCTSCGICSTLCPQNCITIGTPYYIQQEHCLHCGLCEEHCPSGAIIKRG